MKKSTVPAAYLRSVYRDEHLINCAYSGLFDSPLDDFYHILGLDEIIAFGAASYKLRKFDYNSFANFVKSADVYKIFKKINSTKVYRKYDNVFHWLNSNKKIKNVRYELKDKKLNPFSGKKNLEARLHTINPKAVEELKQNLKKRTSRDNYPAPHDVYPELARILREYPQQ